MPTKKRCLYLRTDIRYLGPEINTYAGMGYRIIHYQAVYVHDTGVMGTVIMEYKGLKKGERTTYSCIATTSEGIFETDIEPYIEDGYRMTHYQLIPVPLDANERAELPEPQTTTSAVWSAIMELTEES